MKRPLLALIALACTGLFAKAEDAAIPLWAGAALRALCLEASRGSAIDTDQLAALVNATPDTAAIIGSDANAFRAAAMRERLELDFVVLAPGTPRQRARLMATVPAARGEPARPLFFVQAGSDCATELGRALAYTRNGSADRLFQFTGNPLTGTDVETLNPPVPDGVDPGGVRVAHIDTGVAYTLANISARLARDAAGAIVGADLADNDGLPFDLDPQAGPLFPRRHGTSVATILLSEAAEASLVAIRYPGRNYSQFGRIVESVAASGARVAAMPLGGYDANDWASFEDAARARQDILFIVSAGNDGRDIDAAPVFPAAFDLDNLLVVTSSDAFGQLAAESNWGATSVDIAVPAEGLTTKDHRGAVVKASGASFAVPRIAALAARFAAAHPDWNAARIKGAILDAASPLRRNAETPLRHGWIPDPTQVAVD